MKRISPICQIITPLLITFTLTLCSEPEPKIYNEGTDKECVFKGAYWDCGTSSFSLVNYSDLEDCLIGFDNSDIHPDSISITNSRGDTMAHEIFEFVDGVWYSISGFSVFQELNCFNPCVLDSAFTRYYYLNVGMGDIDTIEFYFPAFTQNPEVKFNGKDVVYSKTPSVPENHGSGYSQYYLRKKI